MYVYTYLWVCTCVYAGLALLLYIPNNLKVYLYKLSSKNHIRIFVFVVLYDTKWHLIKRNYFRRFKSADICILPYK
jgi:hypothetical protein